MALKRRVVAESCFEFLHVEMVDYFFKQAQASVAQVMGSQERFVDGKMVSPIKQAHSDCLAKLDKIGFQVGWRLAERYSKDQLWLHEHLDVIKFICKGFWTELFKKPIDKLQTNYKGIYVLHDNEFKWILRLDPATSADPKAVSMAPFPTPLDVARLHTSYAAGLLRGALQNLGMRVSVRAELLELPQCQFVIVDLDKKKSTASRGTSEPPKSDDYKTV